MHRSATELIEQRHAVEPGNHTLAGLVHVALDEQGDIAVDMPLEDGRLAQLLPYVKPCRMWQLGNP
ncbi:hypothetical protein D3C85_1723060 [compost metagenome]